MDYGYYPGCSLHGTAKEFALSIEECCQGMGIRLKEVPDWNCCGATAGHETSEELDLALSLRILGLAERNRLNPLLVPCASCYSRLKLANIRVTKDRELLRRINELAGQNYEGRISVKHLTEALIDNKEPLKSSVVRPLTGIKIACYYGCLLARPPEVADFDDAENPVTMDQIVTVLGAEPLDWSHKTECCGASFTFSKTDITLRLVGNILEAAKLAGADAIAVACPLCHANLDMRQTMAEQRNKREYGIPIIYISQLVGLAQGKDYQSLGLDKHMVSTERLVERISSQISVAETESKSQRVGA